MAAGVLFDVVTVVLRESVDPRQVGTFVDGYNRYVYFVLLSLNYLISLKAFLAFYNISSLCYLSNLFFKTKISPLSLSKTSLHLSLALAALFASS